MRLIFTIFIFSFLLKLNAQNLSEYRYSFKTNVSDQLKVSISDYLVLGHETSSITLHKYKTTNTPSSVWYKKYSFGQYKMESKKIIKLSDNNFLIVGTMDSSTTKSNVFAMKVSPSGQMIWTKRIYRNLKDQAVDAITIGSQVFILANTNKKGMRSDIFLVKLDNAGNVLFNTGYSTSENEVANCLANMGGNLFIGGSRGLKSLILKVRPTNGSVMFSKQYDGIQIFNLFSVKSQAIYGFRAINSQQCYAIGQVKTTQSDYGPTYSLKLDLNDGNVLDFRGYQLGMKINGITVNDTKTVLIGKAEPSSVIGDQGFKVVILDQNMDVYTHAQYDRSLNVDEKQVNIEVKSINRYFITAKCEANSTNPYISYIIADEYGYSCDTKNFSSGPINQYPTSENVILNQSNAGSLKNWSCIESQSSTNFLFECSVPTMAKNETESFEEKLPLLNVSVFPAIFHDYINIQTPFNFYEITLFDLTGKQILNKVSVNNEKINLSTLSNGLYILNISSSGFSESYKMVKF